MFKKERAFKRLIAFFLTMLTMLAVLSGCGSTGKKNNKAEAKTNSSYEENMSFVTVDGVTIQPDDERLCMFPELGFGIMLPDAWMDVVSYMNFAQVEQGYNIGFLSPQALAGMENISEDEQQAFYDKVLSEQQIPFIKILYTEASRKEEDVRKENSQYSYFEKVATLENNTYYIAYNTDVPEEKRTGLTEEETKAFGQLSSVIEQFKKELIIFPVQKYTDTTELFSEGIKALQALDMQGNAVDASIFKPYSLTAINIWATWCGPCVEEMPDLEKLNKNLPENVNFITVCADGTEESNAANDILKQVGASFVTLAGDETMRNGLLASVYAYPTTVFVDNEGELVGDPLVGAFSYDEYMREIEARLEKD